jgi:hypothetical protein
MEAELEKEQEQRREAAKEELKQAKEEKKKVRLHLELNNHRPQPVVYVTSVTSRGATFENADGTKAQAKDLGEQQGYLCATKSWDIISTWGYTVLDE